MRKYLSVYNLLGLLVFALGLFVYWQSPVPNPPKALPLPADEAAREEKLTLNLYRPDPPRGFLREPVVLEVGLGENPYEKALLAWAQATGSPTPLGLFAAEGRLVVDLPEGRYLHLRRGEAARVTEPHRLLPVERAVLLELG